MVSLPNMFRTLSEISASLPSAYGALCPFFWEENGGVYLTTFLIRPVVRYVLFLDVLLHDSSTETVFQLFSGLRSFMNVLIEFSSYRQKMFSFMAFF